MLRKRQRAATRITFWWLSRRPGRLLRHLEIWAKAQEELEEVRGER
jgi:hypothetical protein